MKTEHYFELNESDLKEIVLDLMAKKGFTPKDEISVCINTNENTVDGSISIGQSWGYMKNGIRVCCEVEPSKVEGK